MRGLLAVLVLLAPIVSADVGHDQAILVQPGIVEKPILPLSQVGTTTVEVRVACEVLGNRTREFVMSAPEAPAWAQISFVPERVGLGPQACREGYSRTVVGMEVRFTKDAPALVATTITVQASGPAPEGTFRGRGDTIVQADYYGILGISSPPPIVKGRAGERIVVPVNVTNHGNGNTKVFFALSQAPPSGWTVVLPSPTILEATPAGGVAVGATVNVEVVPGAASEKGATVPITILAESHFASDPSRKGDSVQFSFVAEVERASASGPGLLGAAMALGAALLVARRRRG